MRYPAYFQRWIAFVLSLWRRWTLTLVAAEAWIWYTRGARERAAFRVGTEARLQTGGFE